MTYQRDPFVDALLGGPKQRAKAEEQRRHARAMLGELERLARDDDVDDVETAPHGDSALPGESVRGELREEFVVCLAAGYPDPYGPTPNTYEKALEFQREHGGRIKRRVSSQWKWVGEMVERPPAVRNDNSEATR